MARHGVAMSERHVGASSDMGEFLSKDVTPSACFVRPVWLLSAREVFVDSLKVAASDIPSIGSGCFRSLIEV